jgi:DNA primase
LAVGVAAEVKSRLSVVDVVGETVALKKAGTTYKGLCPFHGERTASFVVTPGRETWHCFGCGLGGDVFSFVMQRDGVTFPEALKVLAAKAGVELDDQTRRDDARRRRLRDALEAAIAFYHTVLTSHRLGQPALDYLRGRGFTDETIEKFQLGWAPGGWDTMSRTVQQRRSIAPDALAEAGLTTPRQSGRGAYDRFRERIIFPIRDATGGAIGLGGRYLVADGDTRDHGPKYLNSPATPLFDKSRTLYLVDRAKGAIRRTGQAVIVEGYTDALMAHQGGFDNVVASLGTALTPGQVALLMRYAKDHELRIALAYDLDPAGQSAGTFGVRELNALIGEIQQAETGMSVGVVRLAAGEDPDEVIRDDPERWKAAVANPVGMIEHLIDTYADRQDVRTPGGRRAVVDATMPTIVSVANPVTREGYLQHLARRTGIDERVLHDAVSTYRRTGPGAGGADHGGARLTLDAVRAASDSISPDEILRAITPTEVELLRLLLLVPDQQLRVVDELGPDLLPSTVARELYRAIVLQREPDDRGVARPWDRDAVLTSLDEETAALARAIYAKAGPDPGALPSGRIRYEVDNLLLDLEADRIEERNQYNLAEQADAERRGDLDLMERLLNQQRHINEERRSLDRRREQARLFSRPVQSAGAASLQASVIPRG